MKISVSSEKIRFAIFLPLIFVRGRIGRKVIRRIAFAQSENSPQEIENGGKICHTEADVRAAAKEVYVALRKTLKTQGHFTLVEIDGDNGDTKITVKI